jgi:release factor glutamine methyltransferase
VVVELCCGAAALGLAIATELPGIELHAADVEPAALACARVNLAGLGEVHGGDLYSALPQRLRGRVDVLVANAPYVPTSAIALMPPEARLHEPQIALDGGADGLDVQRRIAAEAADWLAPSGRLIVETSLDQAEASAAILAIAGFEPEVIHDEDLDATAVIGSRR